ncbi:MAG: UDP-3-O-(3-hydroxymyristoyl)glucosamine N-acyltransferase [Microcystaceae cyanobacterium]
MKFSQIVEKLEKLIEASSLSDFPNLDPEITGISPIDQALPQTLSYIEGGKFAKMLDNTKASAIILPNDPTLQEKANEKGMGWLTTSQPRLTFAYSIGLFYQPFRPHTGIHPSAVIDPSVVLGADISIGANVVIEKGAKIGDGVCIHPNVVIYPEVQIGDRTILHANCTIHERSQIGIGCVIHSGCVVGAEGFGFVPIPDGWFKMEQSGYVVLEDGVEMGCNSAVDRPAVGETRIGQNTKVDNMVHIGHGCQIGENCALAGQVGLAGGVNVGNRVILAGQVGIANQAKLGDGVIASAQTGIHNDVAAGEVVSGSPSMPHSLFLKVSAVYKRLPEIYKTMKKLSK